MSYSVQDIDTRLKVVEDKLDFVMRQFKLNKQTLLPTLDSHGNPLVKVEVMSLLDVYHSIKNGSVELISNGGLE